MSNTPVLALTVDNLSVTYKNGYQAIRNATFSLDGGTICALVGVNGSGKSTLFKSIMGLVKICSGQVRLNGEAVVNALKKNLIAYVPQTEEIDWNFPVLVSDVVMMGRYGKMNFLRIPRQQDRDAVKYAMARLEMSSLSQRQIGELSGGQKKRVFLARALAQQGYVLLLDEPFTGIDVKTEYAIIDLLRTLRDEGYLILVATHNLGSIPDFSDNVILVNRTVLTFGPTSTTFTQSNLEKTFGSVLRHINLGGQHLHDDDVRTLTVLTDDERPAVFYGAMLSNIPAF
ncbi:MAG: ATP-binding cassette domain-containing protein [Candidatus Malihini olakiniferum]